MIDLVNKAKGLSKPIEAPEKVEIPQAHVLYTKATLNMLKCVLLNKEISVADVARSEKLSRQYVSQSLLRFLRAGILVRSGRNTGATPVYIYSIALSYHEIQRIIKQKATIPGLKAMGPIEKKILSVVKQLEVCRVHQIAEAIDSYKEYVGVYLSMLIKRGLVVSTKLVGTPGTQCVYSINHKMVA